MRRWPDARFWRLWAVALALSIIPAAVFLAPAHAATMRASFYGAESGELNADGSRFQPMGFTAASRTLPFGQRLEVCLVRCAIVTVRDRGPAAWTGRALDLARGAARAIGLEARGVADITVRIVGRAGRAFAPRHAGRRRARQAVRHNHHRH